MRLFAGYFFFVGILSFQLGCSLKSSSPPHVVVLAVEGLGFDRVPCQSDAIKGGLVTLCQESVRFTHAYTNSTSSLANLTTILTGLLPWEHGVRGSSQWLRPQQITVAERALERGYRTVLVSSGLPVLSKSGLGQGFEQFDDRIQMFRRPHFRPAEGVVDHFLDWLEETSNSSFFAVLHFSDLLYPFEPSYTKEGDPRDLSVSSQLDEISEELGILIHHLKREALWDKTYLVLVGISGGKDLSSLKSDQTQVTLLVKPPRLRRDQGTSWGVDFNVSLVDVGVSLLHIMGVQLPEQPDRTSLSSVYTDPTPNWPENRLIQSEMYWAFENFGFDIVRSGRRGHFFYIHTQPPQLFNTLTDRQEQAPLPSNDTLYAFRFDHFKEFAESGTPPADPPQVPDWFYIGVEGFQRGLWSDLSSDSQAELRGWLKRYLLEENDMTSLLAEFQEDPWIQYVANKKLSSSEDLKGLIQDRPCAPAFLSQKWSDLQHLRESCDQDRLLQYLDWAQYKGQGDELYYENRFRRSFQFWWAKLELGAMNYAAHGALGLPLSWPLPPDLSELFLIYKEKHSRRRLMKGYTSQGRYN